MRSSVDPFSHVIYPDKLAVANRTLDLVAGMKPPRTVSDLRSFLGLSNVYCRFVPDFSRTAGPFTAMLRKGEPARFVQLSDAARAAFVALKDMLVSTPVLDSLRHGRTYVLDTDACNSQVGCVLMKPDDEKELRSVGY